jgi:hypothetical protein
MDWATNYPNSVEAAGTTVAAVRDGGARHAADARLRAYALFDAFLSRLSG